MGRAGRRSLGNTPAKYGQVGIVVSQMTELLIARRYEFHCSSVVVVQHTIVIIESHHILKFSIDQHRAGMACQSIQFKL